MTQNPAHRNLAGRRPIRQQTAWPPVRRRSARALSAAAAGLAACTAAIALAGCGTVPAGSGAAGTGHHASPAASGRAHSQSSASGHRHAAAKVDLAITVRGMPGRPSRHWTLQCVPPGGTHPDAVRACRALLRSWHPLELQRRHRMECPMIAQTSGQAEISGTWFGHKVHRLVVNGGCDIGLWAELGPVFH